MGGGLGRGGGGGGGGGWGRELGSFALSSGHTNDLQSLRMTHSDL